MKILLTGVAGFIGYHVAEKLLEEGHDVIGIDNLNDYYNPALKKDKLEPLKEYNNFSFHKLSIEDKLPKESVDMIVHLAAQAGVRYSIENPHIYEKRNNKATLHLFEYARKQDVSKVIYASSSSVYGEKDEQPFTEDMQLDKPVSIYAATKKVNELYAHVYHDMHDIDMIGLRFFTVYGPWNRPDMAAMLFANNIMQDKPIKVFNHGDMRRDWTYVEDIAEGVLQATKADLSFEIINLCNGEPIELMDFITTLEKHLGKEAEKNFLPMQPGDVKETYGDNTKAQNLLGYNPTTSLDDGIEHFVDWYKDYYIPNHL